MDETYRAVEVPPEAWAAASEVFQAEKAAAAVAFHEAVAAAQVEYDLELAAARARRREAIGRAVRERRGEPVGGSVLVGDEMQWLQRMVKVTQS